MSKSAEMPTFREQLEAVRGKLHIVNTRDEFERNNRSLLGYWSLAESLFQSAQIIWNAQGPPNVAAMLAGMSMELLLKGIHVAFEKEFKKVHDLRQLCRTVGISVSQDDAVILQALSELIYWASRYPAPNNWRRLFEANEIFDKQRRKGGSLAKMHIEERWHSRENCERLWSVFSDHYHEAREARLESAESRH